MPVTIGGTAVGFSTAAIEVSLPGATAYLVPSGQYMADIGRYTSVEWLDPSTGLWRSRGARTSGPFGPFWSDGTNVRLINRTGCPQGAVITAAGSGYTNGIGTIGFTVSSGGSVWQSIVGGALSSATTVTTAGAYNYPPTIVYPPPVTGGLRATAIAVISSANVLSSVTVINRGAGYTAAPTSVALNNTSTAPASSFYNPQSQQIQIIQDPRDTAAGGAVITATLSSASSGTLTGLVCTDPGTAAQTTLPTLTAASGVASATVIMNWTATGITVNGGGGGYGNAQQFVVTGGGLTNQTAAAAGDLNPANNIGLVTPRNFWFEGTATSAGAVSSASIVITDDAGFGIQRVPEAVVIPVNASGGASIPSAAATVTIAVGATNDTSWLEPLKL